MQFWRLLTCPSLCNDRPHVQLSIRFVHRQGVRGLHFSHYVHLDVECQGGGDAGSLTLRRSVTPIWCMRWRSSTDKFVMHLVRTTTTTSVAILAQEQFGFELALQQSDCVSRASVFVSNVLCFKGHVWCIHTLSAVKFESNFFCRTTFSRLLKVNGVCALCF